MQINGKNRMSNGTFLRIDSPCTIDGAELTIYKKIKEEGYHLNLCMIACHSRRVSNVNSWPIFEILNKEYKILEHALQIRALFGGFSERLSLSRFILTFLTPL